MICVKVEDREDDICVHIRDNGIGIAARNSNTGGSGLGLAITKKIVTDHKGQIMAESEVGKGTTISFTIPKIS